MPERPKPRPGKKKSPARRLQDTLNEMSTAELCDLMTDIQAKIRKAARPPKSQQVRPPQLAASFISSHASLIPRQLPTSRMMVFPVGVEHPLDVTVHRRTAGRSRRTKRPRRTSTGSSSGEGGTSPTCREMYHATIRRYLGHRISVDEALKRGWLPSSIRFDVPVQGPHDADPGGSVAYQHRREEIHRIHHTVNC